ncbi:MAG: extracellular solute-binding protein family 1 [Clostridia bacterium]|nr:extracellular solute-binding protein family 1 [Clostridia bacterium]
MKITQKSISLLLMLLLVFAMFSACGTPSADNTGEDGTGVDEEVEYLDFNGREFIVATRSTDESDLIIPSPENISLEADASRTKIALTEQLLNCKVSQIQLPATNVIMADVTSGTSSFDIGYGASYDEYGWYKAGLLLKLNDIEALDITDESKWGTAEYLKSLSFKDEVYALGLYAWSSGVGGAEGILLVNDGLVNQFNQPHPKELLEQGQWTFETFLQYVQDVSDINADTPIYGMTIFPGQIFQLPLTAVFANGGTLIETDSDGRSIFGLDNSDALSSIEWAKSVYDTGVVKEEKGGGPASTFFSANESTLWLGGSWVGLDESEWAPLKNLNSFTWVTFPYGPKAEYGKTIASYNLARMGLAIPSDKDGEEVGYFMNILFSEREDFTFAQKSENVKKQFFFDPADYDTAVNLSVNAVYTHLYAELSDVRDRFFNKLVSIVKGKSTPTEAIASIKENIQTEIDKYLNS